MTVSLHDPSSYKYINISISGLVWYNMSSVKYLALLFNASVVVIILIGCLFVYTRPKESRIDNAENKTVFTRDTCGFQYKLKFERVWISVCYLQKTPVVDIRQFINNNPSIKGIQLSTQEWKSLLDWIPTVNYIVNNGRKI